MSRQYEAYLEDIIEAIDRIERYTDGMEQEEFADDDKTVDAVVSNLANIGEAVKQLPDDIKKSGDVDWNDIAGLRDVLVHQYFRADRELLWDILTNELPDLRETVETIQERS